jgi:hypothetical protein
MDLNTFKEYINLHLISLEQDSEAIQEQMDNYTDYDNDEYRMLEIEDMSTNGQIIATAHLIAVLNER